MTKPSRPKRKHETKWTITTIKKSKTRGNVSTESERKSITRPVRTMKQLNITMKDQKVCSTVQFEALPNEVICHVFTYLKIIDLLNCGLVSKRLRTISIDDQYLWPKKLNLCYKKVPVEFLQRLLDSGCEHLSLAEAILERTLNLPKASTLKYLNLSSFGLKNRENSEKLLESCYSLQKLSLSRFQLSSKLIDCIWFQNGKTLRVLDLSNCSFYCPKNDKNCITCNDRGPIFHNIFKVYNIVKMCTELKELSLHMTDLHEKSIDILVSNLTLKIEKLDLFDMEYLGDEHVNILVTRCKNITELNLGGLTSITKNSLNIINQNLKSTLVKLNFAFTDVMLDLSDIFDLKNMEKLELFCYDLFPNPRWMDKLKPIVWVEYDPGNIKIACPSQQKYNPNSRFWEINHTQGLWEIKTEKEELFTA